MIVFKTVRVEIYAKLLTCCYANDYHILANCIVTKACSICPLLLHRKTGLAGCSLGVCNIISAISQIFIFSKSLS